MTIAILALMQGVVFANVGVAVRTQYSMFRGFDFMVGGLVLVCAEVFAWTGGLFPNHRWWGLVAAWLAALVMGLMGARTWNWVVLRIWGGHWKLGAAMFVGSLGASTAVSGLIGLLRGPGLVQGPWGFADLSVGTIAFVTLAGLVVNGATVAVLWGVHRSRRGFALVLYGQNPEFAMDVGVSARGAAGAASLVTGMSCGAVGGYLALADGSRPELSMLIFLYGAAAALLIPRPTLPSALLGGLLLGACHVLAQLFVSPAIAGMLLFAVVAMLILVRGSSRAVEGVR